MLDRTRSRGRRIRCRGGDRGPGPIRPERAPSTAGLGRGRQSDLGYRRPYRPRRRLCPGQSSLLYRLARLHLRGPHYFPFAAFRIPISGIWIESQMILKAKKQRSLPLLTGPVERRAKCVASPNGPAPYIPDRSGLFLTRRFRASDSFQ